MIANRLNIIVIACLILLLMGVGAYCVLLSKKIESLGSYKSLYQASVTENKVWKDKEGYWRNKAIAAEVTKDNLDQVKELQNLSAEFSGLKKNLKNLENYINVNSQTTIHRTLKIKDTTIFNVQDSTRINLRYFAHRDKWGMDSVAIKNDSAEFFHQNRDSLSIVGYWERKWFLGKKSTSVEIKSHNPNTKIEYQRSIKVKRKRWY